MEQGVDYHSDGGDDVDGGDDGDGGDGDGDDDGDLCEMPITGE